MWISCINTNDCECCKTGWKAKQKWYTSITSHIGPDNFNKFIKEKPSYICEKPMKKVLKEYYSQINIFLKQNADILPDHRDENHKIELLESKQAFFVQNYKLLLEQEIDAMKKYINEHFRKSFIKPSLSAAAALILLVRKLESGLKFYVDYRALNTIIIKNRYLIPLINEILNKLLNIR